MLNIAYIGLKGLPSKGGVERVGEAVILSLKDRHRFTVYCSKSYTPKDTYYPGVRLVRLPCLAGKHLHPITLNLFAAIHALFASYDLIHVHNAEACFVAPLLRLKYAVIGTSHGQAYDRDKWSPAARLVIKLLDLFYVLFPDKLTSVSLPDAKAYTTRWSREVLYLPNGVEVNPTVDIKTSRKILEKYNVGGNFILFAAGRMDRSKGCHFLLEAFVELDEDLDLVVIGDNDTDRAYIDGLKRTADPRVKFIPFIARKDVFMGVMRQAKLFVFPSLYEAMSIVLLEAATLGVPLIASDIPANTAILPDHAVYFRSGDVSDLRDKLRWVIGHPDEMKDMGMAAQSYVKENFAWGVISEEYSKLYQSAAANSW